MFRKYVCLTFTPCSNVACVQMQSPQSVSVIDLTAIESNKIVGHMPEFSTLHFPGAVSAFASAFSKNAILSLKNVDRTVFSHETMSFQSTLAKSLLPDAPFKQISREWMNRLIRMRFMVFVQTINRPAAKLSSLSLGRRREKVKSEQCTIVRQDVC